MVSNDLDARAARAAHRREVLVAARCSTYELQVAGGDSRIMCLCCGFISSHPRDVEALYCGFCHDFHLARIEAEDGASR